MEEPRCGKPEASREVRGARAARSRWCCRLLRGESLDLLAREAGQPAGRMVGWRAEFLQAGSEGLRSRPRPEGDRRLVDEVTYEQLSRSPENEKLPSSTTQHPNAPRGKRTRTTPPENRAPGFGRRGQACSTSPLTIPAVETC
jgi:hypothetical protein